MLEIGATLLATEKNTKTLFLIGAVFPLERSKNPTMVRYGRKDPVDSLLQDRREATSLASGAKTNSLSKSGICKTGAWHRACLELLKSRGMFLSPHEGNPLPFESMKDISEVAKSRYKADVESDHH